MTRTRAGPALAPIPRSRAFDALGATLVALVAVLVFYRTTHYFFSADDFDGLARARGILPPRDHFARFLPWHLFFPAFSRAFGLDPLPYHLASLAAHAAASALVYAWIRPLTGRWSALAGATFYAAHPAHYGSVYWISAICDPLAISFGLLALVLRRLRSPARWLALPAFALALMSKESALLVPVAALLEPPPIDARTLPLRPRRDPVVWAMVALAAGLVAYYLAADPFASRKPGALAYVHSTGPHLAENLLTYAGWTVHFIAGLMRSMSDAVEVEVYPWGIVAIALWAGGAFVPGLRRRGWLLGGAVWIATLAPVIPLAHHTYRYYLGGPLAGIALCVAALASWAEERLAARSPGRGRRRGVVALAFAAALAVNGVILVGALEFAPFGPPGLRADAYVDRALIAHRVVTSLRGSDLPDGVVLRFWSPVSRSAAGIPDSADTESYWEKNVRTAILDGLGVRVEFPAVRRVEFVPRFAVVGDTVWYAVYKEDGSLVAGPASSLAAALGAVDP